MEETQTQLIPPASEQAHHAIRVSSFCFKGSHRACTSNKSPKPEEQPSPSCVCDCHPAGNPAATSLEYATAPVEQLEEMEEEEMV